MAAMAEDPLALTLGRWDSGTLALWTLWHSLALSGTVDAVDALALWHSGTLALWHCSRRSGTVDALGAMAHTGHVWQQE
jgi:hypothetical protein